MNTLQAKLGQRDILAAASIEVPLIEQDSLISLANPSTIMPISQPVSPSLSRISSSASFTHFGSSMVPIRPPTAPDPEVSIKVRDLGKDIKLAVDAAPGCGGIAWPAGEVRLVCGFANRARKEMSG